jgi:hypothetical protein
MKLTSMLSIDDLFKGRHFDRVIIILCVCWYLRFKLSCRRCAFASGSAWQVLFAKRGLHSEIPPALPAGHWLVALNLVEAVDLSVSLRPPTAF